MILFAIVATVIFGTAALLVVGAIVTTPGPFDKKDWIMASVFMLVALICVFIAVVPWLFFVAGAS